MGRKANVKITVLFTLLASAAVAAAITVILAFYYRYICFQMLGGFCGKIIQEYPGSRQYILELLKTQDYHTADKNILTAFGYTPSNLGIIGMAVFLPALLVFLAGSIMFLFSFCYLHKKLSARIQSLTGYLEKINTGSQGLLLETPEDEFSKLQDEIYKTVTTLYQTRDAAVTARNNFAENLSNIAHQLKTPVTSISLSVQMAAGYPGDRHLGEIKRQVNRLDYLEESLLLLSRIDAGTLTLNRKPVDVFTLLELAAGNLYELSVQKGVLVEIPETGGAVIMADPGWTMEAILNLVKDCMEASEPGNTVFCTYEKNPLYVQVRIWDEGRGFAKEDLPHLFERFYRGKETKNTGIGIGLSISRAIIEMQDGIIRAFNLPGGGACFEIHFYSH